MAFECIRTIIIKLQILRSALKSMLETSAALLHWNAKIPISYEAVLITAFNTSNFVIEQWSVLRLFAVKHRFCWPKEQLKQVLDIRHSTMNARSFDL